MANRNVDLSPEALRRAEMALSEIVAFRSLSPAREKVHQRMIESLKEYFGLVQLPDEPDLVQKHLCAAPGLASPLSIGQWRSFIRWYAGTSHGTLRDQYEQAMEGAVDMMTVNSLIHVVNDSFATWERYTQSNSRPSHEREQVKSYVTVHLAAELRLINAVRRKPVPTFADFRELLYAAYKIDRSFRLAIERINYTAVLKLLLYSASRPGEITLQGHYSSQPDATRWKDLVFSHIVDVDADGNPRATLTMKYTNRLVKTQRGSSTKAVVLTFNPTDPLLCPVIDMLAIGQSQDVFEVPIENIVNFSPDGLHPGVYTVPLKADKLEDYVFCATENHAGTVLITKRPLRADTMSWRLSKLAPEANFDVELTSYAFRRTAFNQLNRSSITVEDRRHLMGHSANSKSWEAYIDDTSQVDLQGLVTSGKENREQIAKSKQLHKPYELPKGITTEAKEQIFELPVIKKLTAELDEAYEQYRAKYHGLSLRQAQEERVPEALRISALHGQRKGLAQRIGKGLHRREVSNFVKTKELSIYRDRIASIESATTAVSPSSMSSEDILHDEDINGNRRTINDNSVHAIKSRRRDRMLCTIAGTSLTPLSTMELIVAMQDSSLLVCNPVLSILSQQHPPYGCSICGKEEMPYGEVQSHRRKCAKLQAVREFIATSPIIANMKVMTICPLKTQLSYRCNHVSGERMAELAKHLYSHHVKTWSKAKLNPDGRCLYPRCNIHLRTTEDYRVHLELAHQILPVCGTSAETEELLCTVAQYCYLCQTIVIGDGAWRLHCDEHREEVLAHGDIAYMPLLTGGVASRPGYCPFCLHDNDLPPEVSLRGYGRVHEIKLHIHSRHITPLCHSPPVVTQNCPIPSCTFFSRDVQDFFNHYVTQHDLPIFGYHGVAKGRAPKLWDGLYETLTTPGRRNNSRVRAISHLLDSDDDDEDLGLRTSSSNEDDKDEEDIGLAYRTRGRKRLALSQGNTDDD